MCYKSPGPRCSNHAWKKFARADRQYRKNPTPENEAKVREALGEFYTTPRGIAHLFDQAKQARKQGSPIEAERREQQAKQAAAIRRKQLLALKEKNERARIKFEDSNYYAHAVEEQDAAKALRPILVTQEKREIVKAAAVAQVMSGERETFPAEHAAFYTRPELLRSTSTSLKDWEAPNPAAQHVMSSVIDALEDSHHAAMASYGYDFDANDGAPTKIDDYNEGWVYAFASSVENAKSLQPPLDASDRAYLKTVEKDFVESQYNYWQDRHQQTGNAFTKGAADAWGNWRDELSYIDYN